MAAFPIAMKRIRQFHRHVTVFAEVSVLFAAMATAQSKLALDTGSTALSKGDYKGAEAIYRTMLADSPQSPEILSDLGITLQMEGRSSEAIHEFELALKQRQMPRIYTLLAEEKCKIRDLDGARPMLARITREDSKDPSIMAIIAPCYLELDEPIESVQAYDTLSSYSGYPTDLALMQLAKSYRKAAQFFYGRLNQAPDKTVYVDAIREAKDKGSPNARDAFESAAKSSPYFQPDLDFSSAIARWREHPQDTALLYLLNVISGEQSMRQVEICDERYPDSPYLAQLKAEILADQGHEDEAAVRYEALMQTHPELPDLLYDLGTLFRKERDWEKALDAFQRQLKRYPDDERSAARVSEALIQLGRWKELSEFLSTRIGGAQPPLWALLDFAEAEQNLDQPERAITVLTAAEKNYPADKSVHYRLMRLYHRAGNAAEAKKELDKFQALDK
jgi:tetratricopeptide (TPR) repeat protein